MAGRCSGRDARSLGTFVIGDQCIHQGGGMTAHGSRCEAGVKRSRRGLATGRRRVAAGRRRVAAGRRRVAAG
eukprot:355639-Chlamydomonas_euryale.AAC.2